jgi:hypothetical protein
MRRAAILLLLLVWASPAAAAVLFMSGFEMGYPPINTIAGAPSDGDTEFVFGGATFGGGANVHAGAWFMTEGNVGALDTSMFSAAHYATPTIACRYYIRPNGSVTAMTNAFRYIAGSTTGFQAGIDGSAHFNIASVGGFTFVTGTATLAANTWTRIDMIYDVAAGGVGQVYVNGVLDINTTHTGTNGNVTSTHVHGTAPAADYGYDDMLCQDGTSPAPDGRVIVRQGVLGSPIDTAWTLSGCSGGIETCWSKTPFNINAADANTGSTTLSLAQTMAVWPFSMTQTGHGPETVTGSSVINAVQIAVVAKTSSVSNGGASMSIRRYVNGIFVADDPITISTVNTFQKSTIFTDSIANLDHYQIGVVKPVTTAALTQTVVAMWMMVDCSGPGCITLASARVPHRVTQDNH